MTGLRFSLLVVVAVVASAAKPSEWQDLRRQIKDTLHVPDPMPALREKSYGQFLPAPDVAADRISYATDYDLRVPAIVYHQTGATVVQHPALIIVNGHGGDKSSQYAYWAGILYARAGAIVLTYDPIGEYERNHDRRSATNQHDTLVEPANSMALRMAGLMMTDILQAAQYLASRKDVDPKRIAVLGFSMGSFISSLACAVSTDIHACVLVGGGDLDGPGGYWDSSTKTMCQSTAYKALGFLGDRGATIFALNAKRGPTLIWNGSQDSVVDIVHHGQEFFDKLHADTVARLGSSKDVFQFGFTPEGGHRAYFLSRPVALWLNDKLKFPNWTKKQIEALPETDLNGLHALGNNIPAVPRDELHAVPETVWTADLDSFVYETWVVRAKAAETGTGVLKDR
jgi:dienelactone hydrolase